MDGEKKYNLSEIKLGEWVTIDSINNETVAFQLNEMGCTPGEKIHINHIAPLGDPIAISVAGYTLSLRKTDAAMITVIRES